MTSNKPYILRATYEWLIDNNMTPHIVVNALCEGVFLPEYLIEDDKVTLNISMQATHKLKIGNDWVEFGARFGGVPTEVSFPPAAVLAIFARENGQGVVFTEEDSAVISNDNNSAEIPLHNQSSPISGVVKGNGTVKKGRKSKTPKLKVISGTKKQKK